MERPDFFSQKDLKLLSKWRNKVYDKRDPNHKRAKKELMDNVWTKTQYWSEELAKRVEGLETYNPRVWMERGWENRKRVSKFKSYTWARIYKKGERNKAIFFTVGTSAKAKSLVYKIDHYAVKESPLSPEQKALCSQLIPDKVRRIQIPYEDIPRYSWNTLLDKTEKFIRDNEALFNEIVNAVWKNKANVTGLRNRLIWRETPRDGYNHIPQRKRKFKGYDTDWEEKQKKDKYIGKLGEELVIEYEKKYLEENKLSQFKIDVHKVKDGIGYDILSYDHKGNEKYIEVKTTTGGEATPFKITSTEIESSKENPSAYHLYRLFNLKKGTKVAEFHDYPGRIEDKFLLEGELFNAFRKNRD